MTSDRNSNNGDQWCARSRDIAHIEGKRCILYPDLQFALGSQNLPPFDIDTVQRCPELFRKS
jgi:hypothetical protein